MPVCAFYQRGTCRYGDNCRYEHPGANRRPITSQNRFGVLNSESPGHGSRGTSSYDRNTPPYQLDKDIIRTDLAKERPIWILSAYGPGKQPPIQLFGGLPREQSFEELRLRHYELAAQGHQQQAIQETQTLVNNAEQQMRSTLNDIDGAIRYIVEGENQHPNRIDICNAKGVGPSSGIAKPPPAPFNQSSTFGQPSAPVMSGTTFGQPSISTFGKPSSSFGQVPTLGKPTNPFGTAAGPAFGQPPTLGAPQTSTFGQASTFGKPSTATSIFGQPSTTPSPFGQPSNLTSTFGQPSNPSTFGKPSNPFIQNALQTSTPGQPSQTSGFTNQPVSAFTTGIASSNIPAQSNPFGQPPASQPSTFGQPTAATTTAPFSRPANSATGFEITHHTSSIPFGVGSSGSNTLPSIKNGSTRKDARGKLIEWKGQRISYIDNEPCFKRPDGQWEKVWFPDGSPAFTKEPNPPADAYNEEMKGRYTYLREHGTFKDGVMPELPPMKDWCSWDF